MTLIASMLYRHVFGDKTCIPIFSRLYYLKKKISVMKHYGNHMCIPLSAHKHLLYNFSKQGSPTDS